MTKPLLSIASITYNHEGFIAQAIDSWLMQKTNFDFEIVIGEDCSTDNTKSIIEEYRNKYPKLIRVIQTETNVGMMANFIRTLNSCRGKYIAACEGDDYWTDPLKLQKQVDFLENNDDFSICFHPVTVMQNGKRVDDFITREVSDVTTQADLLNENFIHTPSVVFRNNLDKQRLPDNIVESFLGDYYLHIFNAQFGKIKRLPELMAVYRNGSGVWSGKATDYKVLKSIEAFRLIANGFNSNLHIAEKWYADLIYYGQTKLRYKIDVKTSFEKDLLELYEPNNLYKCVPVRDLFKALIKRIFHRSCRC